MYIRQGEADDYIMRPGTVDAISKGPSQGKARDYARKISPFNLTAPAYLNGGNEPYAKVDVKQGRFVKYPTQAGAFFQWGLPKDADQDYFRLAYHPTAYTVNHWIKDIQFLIVHPNCFYRYGEQRLYQQKIFMTMGIRKYLKLVLTDTIVLLTDILTE